MGCCSLAMITELFFSLDMSACKLVFCGLCGSDFLFWIRFHWMDIVEISGAVRSDFVCICEPCILIILPWVVLPKRLYDYNVYELYT